MNQRFIFLIIILVMFSTLASCARMNRGISDEVFLLLSDSSYVIEVENERYLPVK